MHIFFVKEARMPHSELLSELQTYYPDNNYSPENIEELINGGTLDTSAESLINILKGALFDETIMEVELHGLQQIFFARVLDNPFDETVTDDAGNFIEEDPDYEWGSYLEYQEKLFITPLEPSRGNIILSTFTHSDVRVLLRIVSSGNSIELGCHYDRRVLLGDMPCLQLSFPQFAIKSTQTREFRAKVPKEMSFKVSVERKKQQPITTIPLNISLNGMALLDPMQRKSNLSIGEELACTIQLPTEEPFTLDARIVHVTNLRDSDGTQFCFGIQFVYQDQSEQSAIENIMAIVQRKHLRELADIEMAFGVTYDR